MEHLKGLNTLRAIASLVVVWSHIEFIKIGNNFPKIDFWIFPNAHFAVTLFFFFICFLITFLLIKEKDKYNTISFKKFYIRRILRIWPLYYLIIFLSLILFNTDIPNRILFFCLTIFPNIPPALKSGWPNSPQIWSIGVEEQFYLFWPFVVYLIPKRFFVRSVVCFIIFYTIFPYLFNYINLQTINNEKLHSFTQKFFYYTKFNCMAYGGLLGYALAEKKSILKYFHNTIFSVLIICIAFGIWFANIPFLMLTEEVYALFFGLMILAVVVNKNIKIDNSITNFLGKISYGIYMYHWIIILLVIKILDQYKGSNYYNLFLYFSVFRITIFISWVSFNTYEKYFLNLKKKFEV